MRLPKFLFLSILLTRSISSTVQAVGFASSVVSYVPGSGFATEFGTGLGYTNALAALGEPSRSTPGPFGGPVDPFSPPFLSEQVVSLGAGGSLTVALSSPITNRPDHGYGIDFMIYGNAGFIISNGDFSGSGVTDGSLFSANEGRTRVSVSANNLDWYLLDPSKAPSVDGLLPTDGAGDFGIPPNPALQSASFAGLDLVGIRKQYAGSAGGAGFDLAWALDAQGLYPGFDEVRFVKIEVMSGRAEIDGISVVPEPSVMALVGAGAMLLISRRRRAE